MTLALAHPIGTSSATLAPRWLTRPGWRDRARQRGGKSYPV